jgi:hypothetical protein
MERERQEVDDKYRPAIDALAQIRDRAQAALHREEFSSDGLSDDFTVIFVLAANGLARIDKIRRKEREDEPL